MRVLIALVGYNGPTEDIVGDDETARAEETIRGGGLGLREDGLEVGWVAGFLGVDEDEVKGLFGVETGKSLQGITLYNLHVAHTPLLERLPGQSRILGRELEAHDPALRPDGVRPHEGRVPDEDADLEHAQGAEGAGEEDVRLGLEVGDHVVGVGVRLDDVGMVVGDVGGEGEGARFGVGGDTVRDGGVGVESRGAGLHLVG